MCVCAGMAGWMRVVGMQKEKRREMKGKTIEREAEAIMRREERREKRRETRGRREERGDIEQVHMRRKCIQYQDQRNKKKTLDIYRITPQIMGISHDFL